LDTRVIVGRTDRLAFQASRFVASVRLKGGNMPAQGNALGIWRHPRVRRPEWAKQIDQSHTYRSSNSTW
jgi:hypothetical protein